MSLVDEAKEWLFGVALKKGVKIAMSYVVAVLASAKVAPLLTQFGVAIDPGQLELALTGFAITGLTIVLNFIKTKTGTKLL